ncbi:MAG: hypothetical protein AAGA87_07300 [Pseudomonadota bacterium]
MDRPTLSFREAQAAYDLICLLNRYSDDELTAAVGPDLKRLIRSDGCRFTGETDTKGYEALVTRVVDSLDGAGIAAAIIVANDLQHGLWSGDARDLVEMASAHVCASPSDLRAAVLRGVDTLDFARYTWDATEHLWPEVSRVTRDAEPILPELFRIARAMDEPTRKSVAAADYGSDIDKHLGALNDVLASEDCLFPKNDAWYPSEVVELVAHVAETPGFTPCTALLLANSLQGRDMTDWFEFRWIHLATKYKRLPSRVRLPILAGIRHLYERDEEFLAYERPKRTRYDPVLTPDALIDLVDWPEPT